MTNIRWVKAHVKKEKATAASFSYEYWFGNNEADIQAKEGADKHGYMVAQKYDIINKVTLAKNAQAHMLKNYIIYINHPDVRKYALYNNKIKGTPTGTKGRHIIRPEQIGKEVQTCGDYAYCLGCGRSTKAKRSTSAKRGVLEKRIL
eukprot:7824658-Heterocapsa_arctica.AAC.1